MIETLRSYLNKNDYYIIVTKDYIYIKNYDKILSINKYELSLIINDKKYIITGNNMYLKKHDNKEIIINGVIESINKYDQN